MFLVPWDPKCKRISLNPVTVSGLWWSKKIPPLPEFPSVTPHPLIALSWVLRNPMIPLLDTDQGSWHSQSIRID